MKSFFIRGYYRQLKSFQTCAASAIALIDVWASVLISLSLVWVWGSSLKTAVCLAVLALLLLKRSKMVWQSQVTRDNAKFYKTRLPFSLAFRLVVTLVISVLPFWVLIGQVWG